MKFGFIVISNDVKRKIAFNPRKKIFFDESDDEIVVYDEDKNPIKTYKKPEHRLVVYGEPEEIYDGPLPMFIDSPFYKTEEEYEAEHFWDDFDKASK